MDDFTPTRHMPLTAKLAELRRLEDEKLQLEKTIYTCKGRTKRKEVSQMKERLNEIEDKQAQLSEAVDADLEYLRAGREPYCNPDEREQPYNECVGYAYGTALFVDSDGMLLCCEIQSHAISIGDTLPIDDLQPFADLPYAEQHMLLSYLLEQDETPVWFKDRFREGADL